MSGLTFTDQFKSVLDGARDNLIGAMQKATIQNGYLLQAYVTKGIRDQKYTSGYKALSERTIEKKAKNKLDSRFLMEGDKSKSEDLWKSFEVIEFNGNEVGVGSNAAYARAQEFGYEARGLPARPYFQPAMEDAYEEMKDNWQNALKETFSR